MSENKSKRKTRLIQAAVLITIVAIVLFSIQQASATNRVGLEMVLHYTDGTTRSVYPPSFAGVLPMQGVWDDSGKQVDNIEANMLLQNSAVATSFTYACAYEVKIDGIVRQSGTITQNVGSGSAVKSAALVTVASGDILGWTGTNNGTHNFEFNVPTGSSLTAVSNEGPRVFLYDGQRVTIVLTVRENVTTTNPPENPPPENPPASNASITLYTKSWDSATSAWVFRGGVPVTVSGASGSSTWITSSSGYVTTSVVAGTYTFSGSYGGYTNSSVLTVAAGDIKAVTLFFGTATAPPQPTYLFSDGFESGSFSAWTASAVINGTNTIVSSGQRTGTRAGSFAITTPSTTMCVANVYKTMTAASTFYARGYFKFVTIPMVVDGDRVFVLMFSTGSPNYADVAYAGIVKRWDGSVRWQLMARNGTAYITKTDSTRTVNPGQYYCIELAWNGVSGTGGSSTMYVDGTAILTLTGINTGYYGAATMIHFGIAEKMGPTQFTMQVIADDCVIDDTHIGT